MTSTTEQTNNPNSWTSFTSSQRKKIETPTRTNIDEINKILGYISDEFKCVHNNFSGTLYAGPLALVFLGRIFFFEWTVVIKWEDVVHVKKQGDGIQFEVSGAPNPGTYDFEHLFNPDKAWSALVSLHNDTILDTPRPKPTPRQVTRSLRRMNSDPLRMSNYFNFDELPVALEETAEKIKDKRRYSRAVTEPLNQDIGTTVTTSKATLEKAWSSIVESTTSYAEVAVKDQELPCDFGSFFAKFVDHEAKFSIPLFMKDNGDAEIQCSKWTTSEDGESKSRVIEYTHPVNAPMAPPMARARKEQTYRHFGELGLVLETKTFVSDIPLTDCFYVADIIRVEPTMGGKVSISMHFDIRFVKSTMFKTIIARTTKGEFQNFMKRLVNFMAKSLGEEPVVVPKPQPVAAAPPAREASSASKVVPNMTVALLVAVLLLQMWIILDMRLMKSEMLALQQGAWTRECAANVVAQ